MINSVREVAEISAYPGKENSQFTGEQKAKIKDVYEKLFGSRLTEGKCTNCITDAWIRIKTFYKTNPLKIQQIMNSKFKLKENTILQAPGFGVYTNANLTDEIAIAILAKNRRVIALFSEYPPNHVALVEKYVAEKSTAVQPETKSEGKKKKGTDEKTYLVNENFEILENIEENANNNKVINVGSKKFCEDYVAENKPSDSAEKTAKKDKFKAEVSTSTKKELQSLAATNEFPEAEWKKLNVNELTEYLAEKLYTTVEL